MFVIRTRTSSGRSFTTIVTAIIIIIIITTIVMVAICALEGMLYWPNTHGAILVHPSIAGSGVSRWVAAP